MDAANLQGKRVLLTGATGFIGSRLVEVLGRAGVDMTALVHQFMNASRLARFPVRMHGGSITDAQAVARAMEGADIVFHLAFGTQGSDDERRTATVEGTRVVCEAALRAGVSRVVHVSTFSVYGPAQAAELREDMPRKATGDVYADSKIEAEKLVLDFHAKRGLPVVVVQPTIVYGPYAFWSTWPIRQLQAGPVVRPEGTGVCNAVYVDDVVRALIAAATVPAIEGEVFLISGDAPCDWAEYYAAYADMIPDGGTVETEPYRDVLRKSRASARGSTLPSLVRKGIGSARVRRAVLKVPAARTLYRRIKSATPSFAWQRLREWSGAARTGPVRRRQYPLESHVELFRSPTRVRIDKAVKALGWKPQVGLREGVARTRAWAQWFGLIGR